MALFTNKEDARIPLLTQLYQVEKEELLPFLAIAFHRLTGRPALNPDPKAYTPELYRQCVGDACQFLNLLRELAVEMMNCAADNNGAVLGESLDILLRLESSIFPKPHAFEIELQTRYYVPGTLHDEQRTYTPPVFELLDYFIKRLYDLCERRIPVRRCEECGSVYEVRRQQVNRFCSHRCSARYHKRRRKPIQKMNRSVAA